MRYKNTYQNPIQNLIGVRILLAIVTIFVFFGFQLGTASAATLSKPANNLGLTGYWSMDDATSTIATDFSGNSNHGTLTNMAAPATATSGWGTGKLGGGLNFDGTNDYVNADDNTALNFGGGDFTVSAWVYNTSQNSRDTVIGKDTAGQRQFMFAVNADINTGTVTAGRLYAYVLNSSGGYYGVQTGTGIILPNTWHHVVYQRTSGTHTLFVDGVSVSVTAASGGGGTAGMSINDSTTNMVIGARNYAGLPDYFSGKIDEVRTYSRALSTTEITALYNTGAQKLKPAPSNNGLAGYWSMNDATSTIATDFSGNGNHGTLTNMAAPATATSGWGNGKLEGGLNFDGVNDIVALPSSSSLNITGDITLSVWVKTLDTANTHIIGGYGSSPYPGYALGINVHSGSSGKIQYYDGVAWRNPSSATAINDNSWHHYVVSVSGGTASYYKDGISEGTSVASAPSSYLGVRAIGSRYDNSSAYNFPGSLDEVRIYNRALSATEITNLYTSGYTSGAQKINASQNVTNTTLDTGLVGMWSFNGADISGTTAFDRSGSSNNGTLTNGPVPTIGKVGQALSFDGTDDYVEIPDSDALDLTGDFTISLWVKPGVNSLYDGVLDKMPGSTGWSILYSSSNVLSLWINNSSRVQTTSVISNNVWQHVTFVKTSLQTQVFVNGVLNATGTTANPTASSRAVLMGRYTNSTYSSTGSLDEVRIYNRALTADEIKLLYNMGK